ncbi:hypothetical protein D3C81_2319250 [compost metagenome]
MQKPAQFFPANVFQRNDHIVDELLFVDQVIEEKDIGLDHRISSMRKIGAPLELIQHAI